MKSVLAFLGMDDVTFVQAEGLNMGADAAAAGMARARVEIDEIAGEVALAA